MGRILTSVLESVVLYILRGQKKEMEIRRDECLKETENEDRRSDIIIVGAGVAGSALAYALGKDGRQVHVIERELSEPDRFAGELLQPGGYLKLIELGLEDCVEDIDSQRVLGYTLYMDGKDCVLPFPLEDFPSDVAGRSFHNGRFVQKMRKKAASLPNVKLEQGAATSLVEENGIIKGVKYKTKTSQELTAYAPLTVVCDGCFSKLRRYFCNSKVNVLSCFVGMVLENCKPPFANYGYIVVGDPAAIFFYSISSTEVRCFIDVPVKKPFISNDEMTHFLKTKVAPKVPTELYNAFITKVDRGNIRTLQNRSTTGTPHATPGALLIGDALNSRHPVSAAGMTVALSDVATLRDILRPPPDLNDASALWKYIEYFYTLREPMAFTTNTTANLIFKVFVTLSDQTMKEIRQLCFDYLRLGDRVPSALRGLVAVATGLNPRPLSLVPHFFAIVIFGVGRLLLPFPSPRRMLPLARLISGSWSIIFRSFKSRRIHKNVLPHDRSRMLQSSS